MLIWAKGKSDRFCHSCEKRQFLINSTMKLALAFKALFEGAGLAFGCGVSPGAFFNYYHEAAVFEIKGSSGFCPLSFCMDLS
jgi:hypothetical protein